MADGFESERSEAYFNGGMKPRPTPRRLRTPKQDRAEKPAAATKRSPR